MGPDEQCTVVCVARPDIPFRWALPADRVSRRLPDPRSTYPHLTVFVCRHWTQVQWIMPGTRSARPSRPGMYCRWQWTAARHDLITLYAESSNSTSSLTCSSRARQHVCRPNSVTALHALGKLRRYVNGHCALECKPTRQLVRRYPMKEEWL